MGSDGFIFLGFVVGVCSTLLFSYIEKKLFNSKKDD